MASLLPQYSMDEVSNSPSYSASPAVAEVTLKREALAGSSSSQRYLYTTKHMNIDLGPRIWGAACPCYGLNGRVEGSIRLSGRTPANVKRVSVTLMARLATSTPQRGTRGKYVSTLMSRTIPVYAPFVTGRTSWGEQLQFSMSLPTEINLNDTVSEMPPSFSSWDANYGVGCDVTYFVKICMLRTSRGPRNKHESLLIPILYLPKSHPSHTSLPTRSEVSSQSTLATEYRETCKMEPAPVRWPYLSKCDENATDSTILISLPETTFTAGDFIPFKIIITADELVLSHMLGQHARLLLMKRVAVTPCSTKPHLVQAVETAIACGIFTRRRAKNNTYTIDGSIKAGREGKEATWCVAETARVEYVLRLTVDAPKHLVAHLPTVTHEKVITLTTDPFGTKERELCATGGIPPPALGLHPALSKDDSAVSYANVFIC